jgi:hypothetical protein
MPKQYGAKSGPTANAGSKRAVAVLTALGDATLRFATRNAAPVRHCRWGWRSPGYANSHTTRRTAAADECLTQ